jgi:predicted DNA-binding protein
MIERKEPRAGRNVGGGSTSTVSVRIDDTLRKILEALAHEERRTVSSILGELIEKHVQTYKPAQVARALNAMELHQREPKASGGPYGDPLNAFMDEVEKLQKSAMDKALDKATKKK